MDCAPRPTIRLVSPGDPCLAELSGIEDAADALFAPILDTSGWPSPPSGEKRAEQPGFLLAAGDPPIGFAHVLDLGGQAHLEQVCVHPDRLREGSGSRLVRAAMTEAGRRGYRDMTLCTFADVPWNAPFYRQLGFREVKESEVPPRVRKLRVKERALGLDEGGLRVVMQAVLPTGAVEVRPAVSVIPLREGPSGLEVFVQHRQTTMDFAAGAVVFPGGRCDPQDSVTGARTSLPADVLEDHVRRWTAADPDAGGRDRARTLLATGLRELQEETGMVAEPSALVPWDRWVTPENVPKRFDVAFYVMHVPREAVNQPRHSTTEATHSGWEPAKVLLEGLTTGVVTMLTPTRVIVEELVALGSVDAVMTLRPAITAVRDDLPVARPRPSGVPQGR